MKPAAPFEIGMTSNAANFAWTALNAI